MHIAGMGGTGKSYLIDAIASFFDKIGCREHLMISAPTGCTTVLIRGNTIHSLTSLPCWKGHINQLELELIWRHVTYLIINKILMISAKLLSEISHHLCLAESANASAADKPIGNVNVIFTGDFGQL